MGACLDTSFSIAPVDHDRSLEQSTVFVQLAKCFTKTGSAFNDRAGFVLSQIFNNVGKLIAGWVSFLDVCDL